MGEAISEGPAPKPDSIFGMRHMIIILLFLATTVSYSTRVSMSVGIVAMTDTSSTNGHMIFNWSKTIQDTILSSFFWGYVILQIPAGMLAGRFGGKYLVFMSMLTTGILNLILPLCAEKGDWIAVCACRVFMGLSQGLLYPSLHGLLGQWAPVSERSRLGTCVYAGAQLGTILQMMLAGVLSASAWGWPSIFYVSGVICLIWAVLWIILGASTPSASRWISEEEQKYIETNAGSDELHSHGMPTPWKKIWTSLPFWSVLFAHCGQSLGFWTLLTELPSYMNNVLGVDVKQSGILSALPYIAMCILSFVFSWISDFLVNREIISLVASRKLFNTISFWGPAAALLVLSYLPAGQLTMAVVILTIAVGLSGAHYVGFFLSHIDLSPNFASTLMGITNCCAGLFSIMAPLSVSAVVRDETLASEWRKVFFISIALYFLGNLFYILFISGEVQDWNEPENTNETVEDGVKKKVSTTSLPMRRLSLGESKF